jgi:hypothetical protein
MEALRENKINYLNIGLMLITAVLSYFFPFETFLLAYAYLGPLHYLTEISWLHDRNYFAKGKYDFLVLLIVGVLLSYAAFAKDFGVSVEVYDYFVKMNLFDKLIVFALFSSILFALVKNLFIKIIAILFLFVFVSGWLSPDAAAKNAESTTIFALTSLVPTLIHVYLFTGLFMLFGALKNRSVSGMWQMVGFVTIPLLLVFAIPVDNKVNLSEYGKKAYFAKNKEGNPDGFYTTNYSILRHFELFPTVTNEEYLKEYVNEKSMFPDSMKYSIVLNNFYAKKEFKITGNKYEDIIWSTSNSEAKPTQIVIDSLFKRYKQKTIAEYRAPYLKKMNKSFVVENPNSELYGEKITYAEMYPLTHKKNEDFIFSSTVGIMLMRFIAFAYLYHYLNWFSKTEVIRWHKVPKIRFVAVVVLWIAASVFYTMDYSLGLSVLFFLSFTHVLLEFPLNIMSIVGIGKESMSIMKNGFKAPSAE